MTGRQTVQPLPYLPDWPAVTSAVPRDAGDEETIRTLLARMTLEEKVGQLIQPELTQLRPEDVRDYKIGSALNGAGCWPGGDRHASASAWRDTVETFRAAAEEAYRDRPFRIPFVWATDAVHGHNNVAGATVFPHNIGLGAAGDPGLLRGIGRATAEEVRATGMGWTFAPTVATPRDRRWGRYYEGYSEDPAIVARYAREVVTGLQGDAAHLRSGAGVIATLKHWVADGATEFGADRGTAKCSEDNLRNIHAAGFLSGIEAGAQAVMVSFSSWANPANYDHTPGRATPYNHKVHGSRYLITDVLKDRIGFDGITISDWDAHVEVAGCSESDGGYSFLAGLDVLMVSQRDAWQSLYRTTIGQVRSGVIPMSRIDDAVTRVLRVKLRAGLFDRDPGAAPADPVGVLGSPEHRRLNREAARKSLVLLKNADGVLPLAPHGRMLVTGSGAASLSKLTGGWTVTWQGDDIEAADLPEARTVAAALRERIPDVTVDPLLTEADPSAHHVAVVVLGEDAYAEMRGTIRRWRSAAYADLKLSYARDLEILRRLRAAGSTIVTVMLTGRPLYVTEEINLSDAFVVAWLPGGEGGVAIAEMLFGAEDFQGRLPCLWPARRDSVAVNRIPPHIPGYGVPPEEQTHEPLLPFGYGLSLLDEQPGADGKPLPLDERAGSSPIVPAGAPIEVSGPEHSFVITGHHTWSGVSVPRDQPVDTLIVAATPATSPSGGPALRLRYKGHPALVYARTETREVRDLRAYARNGGTVSMGIRVLERPDAPLLLACHDDYPGQPGLDLLPHLHGVAAGEWTTLEIAGADLARAGMDLEHVDVPFMLYCDGRGEVEICDVRWLIR
ncbi:glycoside hydrolase family 3 N-terminal domain-containing protein [Actinoplanes sp. NPDC051475]|uniref:glycoside hydrolase family 3 protein n=1 Tax=Actinoplanes sp. NPDC051475 TaxID=3157225 RepID=UPI00344F8DDB